MIFTTEETEAKRVQVFYPQTVAERGLRAGQGYYSLVQSMQYWFQIPDSLCTNLVTCVSGKIT